MFRSTMYETRPPGCNWLRRRSAASPKSANEASACKLQCLVHGQPAAVGGFAQEAVER